jgi:acetyl-CoA carboxylase biotin carboxylase subunit
VFQKILIANRGEIALRVLRTCREMGVKTVAVYSEPDRTALHVRLADQAVCIGPAAPRESYLNIPRVIDAARQSGAQAIHPGYGFLSEREAFSAACEEAGLVFIGPPPSAIRAMGDKISARKRMIAAGVPVVPGIAEPLADVAVAEQEAARIGYPVMLKASAGGGGKGIRIVERREELKGAFVTASGEALSAFGDGRLYLEKYLVAPRHIEVQVLADAHGNCVHFGERECSIQRRHQKLIEETPSVVIDPAMRARMGAVAVQAAQSIGYRNAGTIEMLWSQGEFYFLEMNTRLQVEHAITEMVCGVDLVREQIRIAAGEPLGYGQDAVQRHGHSIEVRINAEDPEHGFVPSTGTIQNLRLPGGPWVRVDSAVYRGMKVGLDYDSMLAKVIVWGHDRPQAIARMERALMELHVGGVRTGAPLALRVLRSKEFQRGETDTRFLERVALPPASDRFVEVAAIATAVHKHLAGQRRGLGGDGAEARGDAMPAWLLMGRRDGMRRWS